MQNAVQITFYLYTKEGNCITTTQPDSKKIEDVIQNIEETHGLKIRSLIHAGDVLDRLKCLKDYKIASECYVIATSNTPYQFKQHLPNRETTHQCLRKSELVCQLLRDEDIIDVGHSDELVANAVKQCESFASAKKFLTQQCVMCFGTKSRDEMVYGPCGCSQCNDCFFEWIRICVDASNVTAWVCPNNIHKFNSDEMADVLQVLATHVDLAPTLVNYRENFHRKLNKYFLNNLPAFKWCSSNCENGFIYLGKEKKIKCPGCKKFSCLECQKEWTARHDGRTCKEMQVPSELSKTLKKIGGIACPNCKEIFVVAKGGCLHLTCSKCKFMFCNGCLSQFFEKDCPFCKKNKRPDKGGHAHCPRNCATMLRDYESEQLESLLTERKVSFDRNSYRSDDITGDGFEDNHCSVEVSTNSLRDIQCPRDRHADHLLCINHYKELLVGLILDHKIDPLPLMTIEDLEITLRREAIAFNPKKNNENEVDYQKRLVKCITTKSPIKAIDLMSVK